MLSQHLKQYFARIGARLHITTNPRSDTITLAVKPNRRGPQFHMNLPHLSRHAVTPLAIDQRRERLVLALSHQQNKAIVVVRTRPRPSIKTLSDEQVEKLLGSMRKAA